MERESSTYNHKTEFRFCGLWLIIMLKPPPTTIAVSYPQGDYDNVVRFELGGEFSEGSTQSAYKYGRGWLKGGERVDLRSSGVDSGKGENVKSYIGWEMQ